MTVAELIAALQPYKDHHHIEVYDSKGELVDLTTIEEVRYGPLDNRKRCIRLTGD